MEIGDEMNKLVLFSKEQTCNILQNSNKFLHMSYLDVGLCGGRHLVFVYSKQFTPHQMGVRAKHAITEVLHYFVLQENVFQGETIIHDRESVYF